MTTKRRGLSKRVRFEVFKRDSFKCQYCGKSAPHVVLHVDHIQPVAKGGLNDLLNLITSCVDCNLGKSDKTLSDSAVVSKQVEQLQHINERREQLEMMAKWRNSIAFLDERAAEIVAEHLAKFYGVHLSAAGRAVVTADLKKYSVDEYLDAARKSSASYLKGSSSSEDQARFLHYIPRICFWVRKEKEDPTSAQLTRLCGLANHNWWRCNRSTLYRDLARLHQKFNVPIDDLRIGIMGSTGIMQFTDWADGHTGSAEWRNG